MQTEIAGEIVKEIAERVVAELSSAITAGISGFLDQLKSDIVDYLDGFLEKLIDPMVGTPALKDRIQQPLSTLHLSLRAMLRGTR